MKKIISLFLFSLFLSFSHCAKKGRPTGGPVDEDPPLFVTADPPYRTVNFDANEIRLYFNEYIKLKDVNKQLVISPPLNPNNPSLITPQGSASKYINIKILDTLLKNTTYIFDFGNSVEDNNEGNKLERFKYVFSTGSYIDSLNLRGSVKNSYSSEKIKHIKLLLYRLDSAYTDSIVYKRKPSYVTSTLDSSTYQFTNLRKGKYFLVALKDATSDYLFDPKKDEIGFYRDTIILPRDSVLETPISVFKEELPFTFKRAKELRKGQLIFGYEGVPDDLNIQVLSDVPNDFKTITSFEKDKDTLNLWHSPIEKDSLIFKVINKKQIDTAVVYLRKKKLDSLSITPSINSTLDYRDTLFLSSNNPIVTIDTSKVSLVVSDSLKVPFTTFISQKETNVGILFEKQYKSNYIFKANPEAFTDIFGQKNDSIQVKFRTKALEDYGDITVAIVNPDQRHVLIQITDTKDNTITQKAVSSSQTIAFTHLLPRTYKIRIIYDTNQNGKWDTGNFLSKQEAESVEYFSEEQTVRANWSLNPTITIKQ